jgi:uncharacterized protein YdeI (YjbR/CyaY-like superfamily)
MHRSGVPRKTTRAEARDATYFPDLAAWRAWLKKHHAHESELWVGFHKRATGKPSMTWPESVDGALAFGWIDGKRQSVDAARYRIRFTPRKEGSIWSAINIARMKELLADGAVSTAGKAAFAKRRDDRSAVYSHEQRKSAELTREMRAALDADARARTFYDAQPAWYRRACAHWIASAKQEATRARRFAQLLKDSRAGRTVPPLTRPTRGAA